MIRFFVLSLTLFLSLSAFARDPLTILRGSKPPTRAQIGHAILQCKRALNALSNPTAYMESVERARDFLGSRDGYERFTAELYCGGRKAFTPTAMGDGNHRCYDMAGKMCFRGTSDEAARLLSFAVAENLLNWDEEAMANPRSVGDKVKMDLVDGPNGSQVTFTLKRCRR